MQANALANAFEQWCQSRPLADHTVRAYQREGGRLRRWWAAPGSPRHLDEPTAVSLCDALTSDSETVLASLGINRPLQVGSLLQAKRILGAFFLWLAQQQPAALTIAMHLKQWRPRASSAAEQAALASATTPAEAAATVALLAHAPDTSGSPRSVRDQWVRQLAFWSNASRAELAGLRMHDFRVREDHLQVRLPARTGHTIWTSLPQLCLDWWKAYRRTLPTRLIGSSPALRSLSRPASGLTEASISRIVAGTASGPRTSGIHPTLRGLRQQFVALGYRSGLRESALARHMRLARAPAERARPSMNAMASIALLADQLTREARGQARRRRDARDAPSP